MFFERKNKSIYYNVSMYMYRMLIILIILRGPILKDVNVKVGWPEMKSRLIR